MFAYDNNADTFYVFICIQERQYEWIRKSYMNRMPKGFISHMRCSNPIQLVLNEIIIFPPIFPKTWLSIKCQKCEIPAKKIKITETVKHLLVRFFPPKIQSLWISFLLACVKQKRKIKFYRSRNSPNFFTRQNVWCFFFFNSRV